MPKPQGSNAVVSGNFSISLSIAQEQQHDSGRTIQPKPNRTNTTLWHPRNAIVSCTVTGYFRCSVARRRIPSSPSYIPIFPKCGHDQHPSKAHLRLSNNLPRPIVIDRSAILSPEQIISAECMTDKLVCMLHIFSDQPDSYHLRPAQEQVTELTKFISREPQWW